MFKQFRAIRCLCMRKNVQHLQCIYLKAFRHGICRSNGPGSQHICRSFGAGASLGHWGQGPCRWGFVGGRGIGAGALQLQVGRAAGMQVVRRGHSLYPMKFIIHLFQCSRANEVIILRCIQLFSMHFVFHLFQCSHVGLLQGKYSESIFIFTSH